MISVGSFLISVFSVVLQNVLNSKNMEDKCLS